MGCIVRYLITGGAGYIGSELVRLLLKMKHNVRILDCFLFGHSPLSSIKNDPLLEIIEGDITKEEDLRKAITPDIDVVIHLAALVGDPVCAEDVNKSIEVNYLATKKIVDLCREIGIKRFIFASSSSVYGSSPTGILNETSELNPVSVYAETKLNSENYILSKISDSFCPIILRLSTVYGISNRMRFDLVINYLSGRAMEEGNINIFGGSQWRPFLNVYDAARAFYYVSVVPEKTVKGQIFNVGERNYMLADIGRIFERNFPNVQVNYIEGIEDKRTYNISFDKIKHIGFTPVCEITMDGIMQITKEVSSGKFGSIKHKIYHNK